MVKFTDECLFKLDERFGREDVPLHARPWHAAVEILGEQFFKNGEGNPQIEEITRAYERLFPEVKSSWPGKGMGMVASLDRVKTVQVGVCFGTVSIAIMKNLGFSSDREWFEWCRNDPVIRAKSAFAFADIYDLAYGIDHNTQQENYWRKAAEQLKLVAINLSLSWSIDSALQAICLAAELAMKGTLSQLGVPDKDLRKLKHNLNRLAQEMTQRKPHRDDPLLLKALSKFPDYVQSRYAASKLTRLEGVALALDAQFVAASAVRRMCGEDFAGQIEAKGQLGPRSQFFS